MSVDPLVSSLSRLLTDLNSPFGKGRQLSTRDCRSQLSRAGHFVSSTEQQDFHEFYMALLTKLTACFQQPANLGFTFVTKRIFPGDFIYRERVHCTLCQSDVLAIHQSSFLILDVGTGSVDSGLRQYFAPNPIHSKCSHCGRASERLHSRQILFLPRSILLFVNRRRDLGLGAPSSREFAFPLAVDLSPYSLGGRPPDPPPDAGLLRFSIGGLSEAVHRAEEGMRLVSVVAFRGRDNAGHYFAYRVHRERLPPFRERWVCANDGRVSPAALEDVLGARTTALLLLYELPA